MMNVIRYEPVFGDQKLFNGAPDDAVYVRYGRDIFIFSSEINCTVRSLRDIPIVAMRRIIPAPKRWTQADKDAGRLPDVGCKCRQGSKDEIVVAVTGKFVVTECQDMSICTTRNDVFIRSYNPIETPAEKAQRERDEWCKKASFIIPSVTGGLISDLGFIHDALVSGELKMPEVVK